MWKSLIVIFKKLTSLFQIISVLFLVLAALEFFVFREVLLEERQIDSLILIEKYHKSHILLINGLTIRDSDESTEIRYLLVHKSWSIPQLLIINQTQGMLSILEKKNMYLVFISIAYFLFGLYILLKFLRKGLAKIAAVSEVSIDARLH